MNSFVDDFLHHHFAQRSQILSERAQVLGESMRYSVFSGGKRFRPQISKMVAEMLEVEMDRVTPFAAAVELVHTYSLIHDDLPCMDDDDFRRGQPTNHRVFGESIAVLSGDALLTEAFLILAQKYSNIPEVGLELVKLLGEAAGATGMIAGQVEDIKLNTQSELTQNSPSAAQQILKLHQLKTGELIRISAYGVGVIARLSENKLQSLNHFGAQLGLAFQLADDILDYDPQNMEASGLPRFIGINETKKLLNTTSDQAISTLVEFGVSANPLRELVKMNLSRHK